MIGVIVVPSRSPQMRGLDAERSLALLPVGDRPLLQHIVETLVAERITSIELIVSYTPNKVEALLGNGDRWGCKFRYHFSTYFDRPYHSLRDIAELTTEPWCLVHAGQFPCVPLNTGEVSKPILFCGASSLVSSESETQPLEVSDVRERWGGTAIFPGGSVVDAIPSFTREQLILFLGGMVSNGSATLVRTPAWMDSSTPSALLRSQMLLLGMHLDGQTVSVTERKPGIWIDRNVAVHPSVELVAPIYIGPNSRLNGGVRFGPNAVIEGECIVDTNTSIEHSLVTSGSYIGQGLELNHVLVNRNLLINARLETSIDMSDSSLLGELKRPVLKDIISEFIA